MMSVRGRVQDPLSAAAGSLNGSPGMGSLSSRLSVQLLLTRQRIPFQTCVELLIPSNRRLWVFQHEFFQQRWESLKGIVLASFVTSRGISVISYLMKMLGCINIDKIIWKLFFLILNKLSKNIIIVLWILVSPIFFVADQQVGRIIIFNHFCWCCSCVPR